MRPQNEWLNCFAWCMACDSPIFRADSSSVFPWTQGINMIWIWIPYTAGCQPNFWPDLQILKNTALATHLPAQKRDSAQHWTMPIGKFIPVFVASLSEVSSPDLSTIGWSLHNADADLMVSDFATSESKRPMTSHVSTSHSHKSSNWAKLDFGISGRNIQGHQSSLANLRCFWKKQLVFTRKVRVSRHTVLW